jgi:ATP phosphoribosyltransferase
MLRIAVPNKRSPERQTAAEMLAEAGYAGRRDPRALNLSDPRNDVEFFFLRLRDIATHGIRRLDVGITGRDPLLDSGSTAVRPRASTPGESSWFAARLGAFSPPWRTSTVPRSRRAPSGLVGDFLARSA